jgi:hypothetical protein
LIFCHGSKSYHRLIVPWEAHVRASNNRSGRNAENKQVATRHRLEGFSRPATMKRSPLECRGESSMIFDVWVRGTTLKFPYQLFNLFISRLTLHSTLSTGRFGPNRSGGCVQISTCWF